MKKYFAKVKEFFARPKVIKWTVIILSVVIVVGSLKALVWTIYTQDKPTFVPEDVREDIQGAIKESGLAIKKVSTPLGNFIVESAYVEEDNGCGCVDPSDDVDPATDDWPTYTDETLGISFKYPEGWVVNPGAPGTFSVTKGSGLDFIGVKVEPGISVDPLVWWNQYQGESVSNFENLGYKNISDHRVLHFYENSQLPNYYLYADGGLMVLVTPVGEGNNYYEQVISTISDN